jgi:hypothetical protein
MFLIIIFNGVVHRRTLRVDIELLEFELDRPIFVSGVKCAHGCLILPGFLNLWKWNAEG